VDSRIAEGFRVQAGAGAYEVSFTRNAAASLLAAAAEKTVLVADPRVAELHPEIAALWPDNRVIAVPAREENKSLDGCATLMRELVRRGIRRDFTLVAFGGGIVQDVTAFSASVLYRGVAWAFVPTTLLAQCDSCIGSKTSINLGETKNVLGNFYPPAWIVIDPAFLETLSAEDVESGIGEMLHYFVYADSPCLDSVIREHASLVADRGRLMPYIEASLSIKRAVIEVDEYDRGERNKFNYGHTFGHAIEAVSGFAVRHGHAVTVGMDVANFVSLGLGIMDEPTFQRLHSLFRVNFPQYDFSSFDLDGYLRALTRDKKNTGSGVTCILAEGPGRLLKRSLLLEGTLSTRVREYFSEGLWRR
jgi:3-dehydroquinate synthase